MNLRDYRPSINFISVLAFLSAVFPAAIFGQGIRELRDALPSVSDSAAIVEHAGYILEYSEEHEQARWVVYKITPALIDKSIKRSSSFYIDRLVKTESAKSKDYSKSGYDRGHLKPAAASKTSVEDVKASFYYSNMSPQKPGFNRGIWKKLEALVFDFAEDEGSLWVVTGPVLEYGLPTIGPNEVAVPRYYYKVILDLTPPELKAAAFILPNEKSDMPLSSFAVPVDKLEEALKIDFFPGLDDAIEDSTEAKFEIKSWNFPE